MPQNPAPRSTTVVDVKVCESVVGDWWLEDVDEMKKENQNWRGGQQHHSAKPLTNSQTIEIARGMRRSESTSPLSLHRTPRLVAVHHVGLSTHCQSEKSVACKRKTSEYLIKKAALELSVLNNILQTHNSDGAGDNHFEWVNALLFD